MIRTAAKKVAWVGRTASMVFGLALVLALLFGVASMAFARDGQPFVLGARNVASSVSTLVKQGAGPALSLQVGSGPPLALNSSARIRNLNADKVDGHDPPLWAVVNAEGAVDRQSGNVTRSSRTLFQGPVFYTVTFDRNVSVCAFAATNYNEPGEITAENASADPNSVRVETYSSEPTSSGARAFHLVVFC